MLHTWTAEGGYYLERPTTENDGSDTPAPPRPPAGTTLLVRDNLGSDQPATTSAEGGYWSYSADFDGTSYGISLSADGGVTWSPILWSIQSQQAAVDSGATSAQALTTAQAAQSTANDALGLAQSEGARSVNGVTPDATGNVQLTAANVGAVSTAGTFPAAQVTGLAKVATSNSFNDLSDRPPIAIPMSQKAAPNGVATLGPDSLIPSSQLPAGGLGTGTVQSVNNVDPDGTGNVTLTAANVGARDASTAVPAGDVSGLATVATTGAMSDVSGTLAISQMFAGGVVTVRCRSGVWDPIPTTRTDMLILFVKESAADPVPTFNSGQFNLLLQPAS